MTTQSATLTVTRDQNHLAWDPAIPPVASVPSGSIVEFDCLDASNGQITSDSTTATLDTLGKAAAQEDANLMPLLVDCAKAYCTLGEMVDVLKDEWGEFVQPRVF